MMGRPPFKPTAAQRNQVMSLRADGWSQERIALVIGIHVETLVEHFPNEILHGAARKRAELLKWAEKGAKKGNPTLIKWLAEQRQMADSGTTEMGKKAEKQAAAGKVDGVYAPPVAPKLIVNNG